eukprot:m.57505 g.57505  ORF g.57505 m.57505 type:complete len:59 (-) comp13733_c0_seq5:607-783(-)
MGFVDQAKVTIDDKVAIVYVNVSKSTKRYGCKAALPVTQGPALDLAIRNTGSPPSALS